MPNDNFLSQTLSQLSRSDVFDKYGKLNQNWSTDQYRAAKLAVEMAFHENGGQVDFSLLNALQKAAAEFRDDFKGRGVVVQDRADPIIVEIDQNVRAEVMQRLQQRGITPYQGELRTIKAPDDGPLRPGFTQDAPESTLG